LQDSFVRQNAAFKIGVFNDHGASPTGTRVIG
jgi:hypothetical protein